MQHIFKPHESNSIVWCDSIEVSHCDTQFVCIKNVWSRIEQRENIGLMCACLWSLGCMCSCARTTANLKSIWFMHIVWRCKRSCRFHIHNTANIVQRLRCDFARRQLTGCHTNSLTWKLKRSINSRWMLFGSVFHSKSHFHYLFPFIALWTCECAQFIPCVK